MLHSSYVCAARRPCLWFWAFLTGYTGFSKDFSFQVSISFSTTHAHILSYSLRTGKFQGQERLKTLLTLTFISPSNSSLPLTNASGGLQKYWKTAQRSLSATTLFSHRPAAHDDPSYSGIIHPIKSFKNLPHHSCWSHAQVQIGIWCMQLQYTSCCSNLLQLAYRLSFVLWTQDSFCLSLFK